MCALVIAGSMTGQVLAADSLAVLVERGQYQEAYEQAQAQQVDRAGDPKFDFKFGLAALESGHPQQAVFALERVLAAEPRDHRARLELARAYFALGDFEQARSLFQTVLDSRPPEQVKQNVQRFLDELHERTKLRDHQFTANAELRLGYDSNINSATTVDTVTLPIGLILTLGETSRELGDEFAEVNAGVSYLKLTRKDMGYYLSAALSEHQNSQYNLFDTRLLSLSGGYVYQHRSQTLRLPLQLQYLEVDRAHFRTSTGLGVEWSIGSPAMRYVLFGQWAQQRHTASEKIRDVNLAVGGAGISVNIAPIKTDVSASLYYADESPQTTGGDHFGRSYNGLHLVTSWRPTSAHELQLGVSAQQVEHDAIHPAFGKVRKDNYRQGSLSWIWRFDPQWRFTVAVNHTQNDSNLPIYAYKRSQEYLSLRHDF
jgi:FimV-like protein